MPTDRVLTVLGPGHLVFGCLGQPRNSCTLLGKPCPCLTFLGPLHSSIQGLHLLPEFFWGIWCLDSLIFVVLFGRLKTHQEPISHPRRQTRWRSLHHALLKKDNACRAVLPREVLACKSVSKGQDWKVNPKPCSKLWGPTKVQNYQNWIWVPTSCAPALAEYLDGCFGGISKSFILSNLETSRKEENLSSQLRDKQDQLPIDLITINNRRDRSSSIIWSTAWVFCMSCLYHICFILHWKIHPQINICFDPLLKWIWATHDQFLNLSDQAILKFPPSKAPFNFLS